jgi:hypothetical protein
MKPKASFPTGLYPRLRVVGPLALGVAVVFAEDATGAAFPFLPPCAVLVGAFQ